MWKSVDLCFLGEKGLAIPDPSELIRCRLFWNSCCLFTYCEKKIAVHIQRLYLSLWLNITFHCSWEVKQEENAGRMVGVPGSLSESGMFCVYESVRAVLCVSVPASLPV